MAQSQTLKAGILGMGTMGSKYAAILLAGKVPGMELAAVTRVKQETLAAIHLTLPQTLPIYPSAEELFSALDRGELHLDAVIIATPHRFHEEQALAAMKRGIHVLCDKPAGVFSRQARTLEESKPSELICGFVFQQRTFPAYQKIRQLVQGGTLGKIKRVSWEITSWYRTNAYYQSTAWRGSWKLDGGGTLLNQCPHNLDLLQWICGMPVRTHAFCHNGKYHPIEVEDEVTAYLEWGNGATGIFTASTGEAPGVNRLEIAMDDGLIICEPEEIRVCRLDRPEIEYRNQPGTGQDFQVPPGTWESFPMEKDPDAYTTLLRNFASSVLSSQEADLIAPWAEGRKSLLLSNAIYLSSWKDETIQIPVPNSLEEKKFEQEFEQRFEALCNQSKPL